jgi:hypothetical protein
MHAMDQMTFAQEGRRRRQNGVKPRSRHCKKRRNVVSAGRGEPHDLCIHELFSGKTGLRHEPPHSRMKPECGGDDFLN